MFYSLLLTETTLCLAKNYLFPIELKDNMDKIKTFNDLDSAELFIHRTLSFDDMWDFGLLYPHTNLEIGRIYHRY